MTWPKFHHLPFTVSFGSWLCLFSRKPVLWFLDRELLKQQIPESRGMVLPAPAHSHHPLHHAVVLGVLVPDSGASLSWDSQLG